MKYLETYENYNDILVLEKLNIKNMIQNFKDTIESTKNLSKRKLAKSIVISLLSIYSVTQASNYINHVKEIEESERQILQNELKLVSDSTKSAIHVADSISNIDIVWNNIYNLKLTQDGWDHIRYEEGSPFKKGSPVLKVYKLGDGMLTVGYGHAERISKSKMKIGQIITKEQARKYFIKDVNVAAKGVKRMFKKWKKEGIAIDISQKQYDVLVSIAYNKGVGSFLKSDFLQELKKGNYIACADLINKEGENSKWNGIKTRRNKESKEFLS